jgi:dienelactone hydrolase
MGDIMSSLSKFLSLALFSVIIASQATTSQAAELTLTTAQGFDLKADYYKPESAAQRGVLLLHQCNLNRTMYNDIGKGLGLRGMHALSMDFRGFGESIDDKTDMKKFGRIAVVRDYMGHWPKDVQLAYDFLREKVGKDGVIGVVGASCGGRQAQILAENNPINALSFFSSNVVHNDDAAAGYKPIANKPTLFISAQDGTVAGIQRAFALNENINSKLISYKGEAHGYPLLEQDKHLTETMVDWFDRNLIK